ncbi:MAG: sulfur carrier protein ThiS [Verrucomicrobiota bacterium]
MTPSSPVAFELNGEARTAQPGTTLGGLAAELGLDPRILLVELNGEALPRDGWTARALQPGDQIEFVRIVAGG